MKDLTVDYMLATLFIVLFITFVYVVIGAVVLGAVVMPYETEVDCRKRLWFFSPPLCIIFILLTAGAQFVINFRLRWEDEDSD